MISSTGQRSFERFFDAKDFAVKENSAVKIQCVFRGFLSRHYQRCFLPDLMDVMYLQECEKVKKKSLKRAEAGKTPTYLSNDVPIVLKLTGKESAGVRMEKMLWMQSILLRLQIQHLIVPKVKIHEEFLIEEHLPINVDPSHNIRLYRENHELFNEPVREMVRLFSRCYIARLADAGRDRTTKEFYVRRIRYDNIPFFLSHNNKKANIGLIDLEALRHPKKNPLSALCMIVTLFPNHLELIIEEAERLGIQCDKKDLRELAEVSNQYQSKVSGPELSSVANLTSEERSAIEIQRVFRRFIRRRDVNSFLPFSMNRACIESCECIKRYRGMETDFMRRAVDGKTPVYFPDNFSKIVVKDTDEETAIFRIKKMLQARSVLMRFGCSHLVVPKVQKYDNFLIEERLPVITNPSINIRLYRENPDLFNEPVREMVRFFSRCYISCLVTGAKLLENQYWIQKIRYDNISFFLSDGNRKVNIGLIDLERAEIGTKRLPLSRLRSLAVIFPNHVEIIAEEAIKLNMQFEREPLEQIAEQSNLYQDKVLRKGLQQLPPLPSVSRRDPSAEQRAENKDLLQDNALFPF